jgi:hypothetical protein
LKTSTQFHFLEGIAFVILLGFNKKKVKALNGGHYQIGDHAWLHLTWALYFGYSLLLKPNLSHEIT